jgi:hypothetical protein
MFKPIFITGEAGAGKTRKLMKEAAELGGQLLTEPYQRALAVAVMHGARRRLQSTIRLFCPKLPATVSTIHSFALSVVNRWRRSLGLSSPVAACEVSCGLTEKHFRTLATFDEIMALSCRLLESELVTRVLAKTYPLIIVDEFQDCTGNTLRFVQALGKCSQLLLAADHFQTLQEDIPGCPAVEWAEQLRNDDNIDYQDLVGCRRTENQGILDAARALRSNMKFDGSTVPVYHAPMPGPAAFRIVERFATWDASKRIRGGTCALIVLSADDPLLDKLLESFEKQMERKRSDWKIHWSRPLPEQRYRDLVFAELGIHAPAEQGMAWNPASTPKNTPASTIARELVRFSKLRGIHPIPQELAAEFAKVEIHNLRSFGWGSPRFQVLTVHGAKNQEFDHVFILWAYKNAAWSVEQQRRLLYNAVTRAKRDCTVLVLGGNKRASSDAVISLLGPAMPAIDPSWKKPTKKKTKKQ